MRICFINWLRRSLMRLIVERLTGNTVESGIRVSTITRFTDRTVVFEAVLGLIKFNITHSFHFHLQFYLCIL